MNERQVQEVLAMVSEVLQLLKQKRKKDWCVTFTTGTPLSCSVYIRWITSPSPPLILPLSLLHMTGSKWLSLKQLEWTRFSSSRNLESNMLRMSYLFGEERQQDHGTRVCLVSPEAWTVALGKRKVWSWSINPKEDSNGTKLIVGQGSSKWSLGPEH